MMIRCKLSTCGSVRFEWAHADCISNKKIGQSLDFGISLENGANEFDAKSDFLFSHSHWNDALKTTSEPLIEKKNVIYTERMEAVVCDVYVMVSCCTMNEIHFGLTVTLAKFISSSLSANIT